MDFSRFSRKLTDDEMMQASVEIVTTKNLIALHEEFVDYAEYCVLMGQKISEDAAVLFQVLELQITLLDMTNQCICGKCNIPQGEPDLIPSSWDDTRIDQRAN